MFNNYRIGEQLIQILNFRTKLDTNINKSNREFKKKNEQKIVKICLKVQNLKMNIIQHFNSYNLLKDVEKNSTFITNSHSFIPSRTSKY